MLMRNPKEFERVAQEWAVKYAGAPKRERGEGSGGSTSETLRQRQQKSKAEEEAERVARCVYRVLIPANSALPPPAFPSSTYAEITLTLSDTVATTSK